MSTTEHPHHREGFCTVATCDYSRRLLDLPPARAGLKPPTPSKNS